MMLSCLFYRLFAALHHISISLSLLYLENKGTFKSHSLNLSLSLCFSLVLSLSLSHPPPHTHTSSYLYCVSIIVCIFVLYMCTMSENHQRVFEDPNEVRAHMVAEISKALLCEARVRNVDNFTPMFMKITIGITLHCLFFIVAVEV